MQLLSGRVRDGVIVLDEDITLPEGTTITILAEDGSEPFDLTPEEEAEIEESIREAEAGHVISAGELLRRLRG